MRHLSVNLTQACKMFGLDYGTVKRWLTLRLIPFATCSVRSGHILDIRGLLAIGLVAMLRRNNVRCPRFDG